MEDVSPALQTLNKLCTATGALYAEVAPLHEKVLEFIGSVCCCHALTASLPAVCLQVAGYSHG